MTPTEPTNNHTPSRSLEEAYFAADLELSSLYRQIAEEYHGRNLEDCEPQEFNFVIDHTAAVRNSLLLDGDQAVEREPDTEITEFNKMFFNAFSPILYFSTRYISQGRALVEPLWTAILESQDTDDALKLKFSLFCYRKNMSDPTKFFSIHRIFSYADTDFIFSMSDFYTTSRVKREYKPFYVSAGRPPCFVSGMESEVDGAWLDQEFIDEIDGLLREDEQANREGPFENLLEIEQIIKRIGERAGRRRRWQDHIHLSGSIEKMLRRDDGSADDVLWRKFAHYIIWLRLMGHQGQPAHKNWQEYWYFPVPDWSLQNLHGLTVALSDGIDRTYFQLVSGHASKLFSVRLTAKYGLRKSLETRLLLQESVAHYLKRRMNNLATTQREITEEIVKHPEIAKKAVSYSILQEATYALVESYWQLRQNAIFRSQERKEEQPGQSPSRISLEELLRTFHVYALVPSWYFSGALKNIDDDDTNTLEKTNSVLKRLVNQFKQTRAVLFDEEGFFVPYDSAQSIYLYTLISEYDQQGRFEYMCERPYSLNLSRQQFIHLYTAFTEIMENSIKAQSPNVFCEVVDKEDHYLIFLTSTNQDSKDLFHGGQGYSNCLLLSSLCSDLPKGGLGMKIICESLKLVHKEISYEVVRLAGRDHHGFSEYIREESRMIQYFWSGVKIPKDLDLLT